MYCGEYSFICTATVMDGKYNFLNHRKLIIIAQSASHIKQTWSQSGVEKVLCQDRRGGAVLNLFALTF